MMRLPHLDAAAKAQLWGLAVSFALSVLLVTRTDLGLGPYVIGLGFTWAAWEIFWGRKLALGPRAVRAALLSGLAIPWGGFAFAWALEALRP